MEEDLSKRKERLQNITATEMAIIFGLNQYETPSSLLEKKLNPKPIVSNHLRRGKLKEPSVLEAFLLDLNMKTYRHEGGTLVLDGHRIAATPDAYLVGTNDVVECKSVTTRNIEKWYYEVPLYYHIQVLVQILVTGCDTGYIGALEEGDPYECEYRFIVWKIKGNDEIYDLMKLEVGRFWDNVAKDTKYRVSSTSKKKMLSLLDSTRIYPTEIPVKEKKDAETVPMFLSLLQ